MFFLLNNLFKAHTHLYIIYVPTYYIICIHIYNVFQDDFVQYYHFLIIISYKSSVSHIIAKIEFLAIGTHLFVI